MLAPGIKMVKFGQTKNLPNRFSALQADSPYTLYLLGAMVAPDWLERAVHDALAAHRVRGEWFWWTEETQRFAEMIAESEYDALMRLVVRPVKAGLVAERERRLYGTSRG